MALPFLLFLATLLFSSPSPAKSKMLPLGSASGPESLAFDGAGVGPYTGVADGRILKWSSKTRRWSTFALPPTGVSGCNLTTCGRPLGLQFHFATGKLYIADAFYGLLSVGPTGGEATQVAGGAAGRRFRFANAVDVNQETGEVFLTDSSSRFGIGDYAFAVLSGDRTGRLVAFKGEKASVLLTGLSFPNGIALGGGKKRNEFVLVAETGKCRVLRYWLRGVKSGKREVFAELPGYPDNVRRRPGGGFWVGIYMGRLEGEDSAKCPVAARLGEDGRVLEVVDDCAAAGAVSEVAETRKGEIWVGSVVRQYVEVFNSTLSFRINF